MWHAKKRAFQRSCASQVPEEVYQAVRHGLVRYKIVYKDGVRPKSLRATKLRVWLLVHLRRHVGHTKCVRGRAVQEGRASCSVRTMAGQDCLASPAVGKEKWGPRLVETPPGQAWELLIQGHGHDVALQTLDVKRLAARSAENMSCKGPWP